MAFTDAELAVLAQLSYDDDIVRAGTMELSLAELLEKHEAQLRSDLGEEYNQVIDGLLEKTRSGDYTVVKGVNEKHGNGFAAFAIQDSDNHVTVACRGTEGFSMDYDSIRDVYADIQLGITVRSDQQRSMEQFMRELNQNGYDGYYFTGHSLGGNLAMHGAISLPDSTKILGVTTFNAPGFNSGYLAAHNLQIQKIQNRMHAYQNEYDYVSSIFATPGRITVVDSQFEGSDWGFSHHSLNGFRIDENGAFIPNGGGKGFRTGVVHGLLERYVNKYWILSVVFGYGGLASKLNKVRDFSPEVREMMLNAARETEEEQWWQIDRWDCWYRVSNFFGFLEFDLYAGNVNDYYRKLIDINDASAQIIQQIFDKAYATDASSAAKLRAAKEAFVSKIPVM